MCGYFEVQALEVLHQYTASTATLTPDHPEPAAAAAAALCAKFVTLLER